MNSIVIIIVFAVIGAGLKYIDTVFDEELLNKKIAIAIAPVIMLIWIWLSLYDTISATILFAILFAVLLTGKVDNLVFFLSSVALVTIFGLFIDVLWIPLLILTIVGIIDEKGNDYADTHTTTNICKFFFLHRFSMKMCMFCLCMFSIFPWVYLIAFLAFDLSYEIVGCCGRKE